jgi:Membrane protein TerC, possibly involved in tellurium resistance
MDIYASDLLTILLLVVLEGLLSADNALVLAILVLGLPRADQKKALRYGIAGAFVFRILATLLAIHLLAFGWIKLVGAGYLMYLSYTHFFGHGGDRGVREVDRAQDASQRRKPGRRRGSGSGRRLWGGHGRTSESYQLNPRASRLRKSSRARTGSCGWAAAVPSRRNCWRGGAHRVSCAGGEARGYRPARGLRIKSGAASSRSDDGR